MFTLRMVIRGSSQVNSADTRLLLRVTGRRYLRVGPSHGRIGTTGPALQMDHGL